MVELFSVDRKDPHFFRNFLSLTSSEKEALYAIYPIWLK
jgi:hypothetical protein